MSSNQDNTPKECDQNKIDFQLLCRRSPSDGSSTSNSTTASNEVDINVWPLHLTPNFIKHFIIGETIGSGSYAEVRECIDTRTLDRLAMKIVNKDYLRRQAPRALANQLQEIRLLRKLRHPNIISMRECLEMGSHIYIALEYCAFNLSDLLDEQPRARLDPKLSRDFFHQLCSGLAYLHSTGVVHRDIKPQNLLINQIGLLKIIDFGVAQIVSVWQREAACKNYEGSPLFQAPEVVVGQECYDGFKVDVWSSGVTLYLMLLGEYPFMDESLLGLYDRILAEPYKPPGQSILIDLFSRLLDKDASRRAGIEEILAHPWLRLGLAAGANDDDDEDLDFLDFVLINSNRAPVKNSTSDIYKSMSVLPYLYKYHFPKLPTQKTSQRRENTPSSSASDSTNDSPDDLLTDEEVEWGTREQYELMKKPQVRANRSRLGYKVRRRQKRRQKRRRRSQRMMRQTKRPSPHD